MKTPQGAVPVTRTAEDHTWYSPLRLSAHNRWNTHAETPAVVVNRDGVVGVAWYDTRHDRQGLCFDLYFSASAPTTR